MGTILLFNCESLQDLNGLVSIPYRYGITLDKFKEIFKDDLFQFLIGTVLLVDLLKSEFSIEMEVSIPYRYGITTKRHGKKKVRR